MAELYNLAITPRPGVTRQEVEKVLDTAVDWYRYQDNCWILYTTSTAEKWYARLEELVKPEGSFYICRLDITDDQGFMSSEFWKWLQKRRPEFG